ncbi:MAG: HigA family addiction module antitoxin [Planctomycetota bacterium]|jgi:HTH-type transcriptional regulator/antitoxin HigA
MTTFVPAEPFPPGEYLKDELDARGWTHEDLATVLGMSRRQVVNLTQGKSGITPDTAHALAEAFGQSAKTWMNLQVSYELALAAQKERGVAKRARIYNKVPVRELMRRVWIPEADDADELEQTVCDLLRIDSIGDDVPAPVAARKGTPYDEVDTNAQKAWYCRAWALAEHVSTAAYSGEDLHDGILELRKLAAYPEDARHIPAALASMGIRLVVLQHLKGTKVDGVAFWLDDTSPAIAISLRFDRIDNLWFTLVHEVMHIRNGDVGVPVDVDVLSTDREELPDREARANDDAADYLIPTHKLDSFIARTKPYFYQSRVNQFAQAQGVHPGIVVGQLQYRKAITYQQLRKLLVKVKDEIIGAAITDGWGNVPTL